MRELESKKRFGVTIRELRRKRGFSQERVSAGLCTAQELSYFEKGEREVPKLLQDALQERLGLGTEDYEHYLDYSEYEHWEARQRILHCITWEETDRAEALLEQYRISHAGCSGGCRNVKERLERQFYLSMLAQIWSCKGAERKEIHILLEEAVQLTVPALWKEPVGEMTLSIKELNLILEAEHYREGGGEEEHYREILTCIDSSGLDGIGMAKIYPKAVYFLCRQRMEKTGEKQWGGNAEAANLLVYCNRAVEILRDVSRMYYLWELLDMREKLLEQRVRELLEKGEGRKAGALEPIRAENRDWKEVLESVYAEFRIPKEMFEYCYLYVEKGVSCVSDVIRIRRKMLGMSVAKLSDGICTARTLRRIENRQSTSQMAIVTELFGRLGLSPELTRTELVTEKPEARQLMEKLRKCINDHRTEEAMQLYALIKELVPAEIRINQQSLLLKAANVKKINGELSGKEYYEEVRAILEITMPYEVFLKEGEKYLTYEEQSCIQNMMLGMDRNSKEFRICMEHFEEMYRMFEKKEQIETVNNMYEYIMKYVGSEQGNLGEYDRADKYGGIIVRECLRTRRLHSISFVLYDRWWNYLERKRSSIPADNKDRFPDL